MFLVQFYVDYVTHRSLIEAVLVHSIQLDESFIILYKN